MTPHPGAREAGFTLLELLVALVVFGFLLAGLTQGVRFGLTAWDRQAHTINMRSDLDAIDRTIGGLIMRLDPVSAVSGRPHAMAFTSELPEMAALLSREADLLLLVDPHHRLVLRWTPHLHAVRLGAPPAPKEAELLTGVDHLDLAYWPRDGVGGWRDTWKESIPPSLIRVRVLFAPLDPRRWPDIVAGPMRDRPDS